MAKAAAAFSWVFPLRGGLHKTYLGSISGSVHATTVFSRTTRDKALVSVQAQKPLACFGTCWSVGTSALHTSS